MSTSRGKRRKLTDNEREALHLLRQCDNWVVVGITKGENGVPMAYGQNIKDEQHMALFLALVSKNINDRLKEKARAEGNGQPLEEEGDTNHP